MAGAGTLYRNEHVSSDSVWQAALDTWMFLVRATAAAQESPWEDDAAELVRGVVDQVVGWWREIPHTRGSRSATCRGHISTSCLGCALLMCMPADTCFPLPLHMSSLNCCHEQANVASPYASYPVTLFKAVPVGFRV